MHIPKSVNRACIFFVFGVVAAIYAALMYIGYNELILPLQRSIEEHVEARDALGLTTIPRYGEPRSDPQPLFNAQPKFDHQRLFYNRVPKCGSSTLLKLVRYLSIRYKYTFIHSLVFHKRHVDTEEQKIFVRTVMETREPCFYDRHLHFVNFTSFGEFSPIYINNVREPVERIISVFYYERESVKNRSVTHSEAWFKKDFEQCVRTNDKECTSHEARNLQMPYFCGHDPECSVPGSEEALRKAKENIEKYFAVVGVLEHPDVTLRVLELAQPNFFAGVPKLHGRIKPEVRRNPYKKEVPEDVKSMLREEFGTEYDLYNYIVQRLYSQVKYLEQNEEAQEVLRKIMQQLKEKHQLRKYEEYNYYNMGTAQQ